MSEVHPFKIARFLKSVSQHDCARRAGLSQSKLSLIELGHCMPTPEEAQNLADLVGGEASELFPGVELLRRKRASRKHSNRSKAKRASGKTTNPDRVEANAK